MTTPVTMLATTPTAGVTTRLGMRVPPDPPPPAPEGCAVVEPRDPPAWWLRALVDAAGEERWTAGPPGGNLADPAARIGVAMAGGWPRGAFVVGGGDAPEVAFLGLVPGAGGLGPWLLAEALARVRRDGARAVTVAVRDHPDAVDACLAAGFEVLGTGPAPPEPARRAARPTTKHDPYTVAYLATTTRHAPPGPSPEGCRLVRSERPPAWWFLLLYDAVGSDYLWDDMHHVPAAEVEARLADPAVALWWLERDGWPQGFFLLDAREAGTCDLAYFGLVPQAVGRGLGGWFLRAALERAWAMPGVGRVTVNTCTLDHPRALPNYLSAGFEVLRREARPGAG